MRRNSCDESSTLTDTDGDGILDCDEIVQQTASIEFSDEEVVISSIDVSLECAGSIYNEVFIEDMAGRNTLSNGVMGLVGSPINIHTDVVFDEAEIVFHYNPEELSNIEEENLGVLWYDEANNQFVIMDNVSVDTEEHCVTCITTHFSEYMLVDKEQWYSVWMQASSYEPVYMPLDIAIISDETAPTFHYWGRGYGYINFPNGYIDGENIIYAYFNAEGVHTHSSSWVSDEGRYLKASESIFYYHFVLASTAPRNGDGKYGDAFVRMVEMFSDSYYEILHSDNPKVVLFTYGGTLQETEEQNQKVEESVEKLQRMGVTVYAVSETSQTNTLIENAAIATGGEHFNALTMEEPQQLWLTIHEKMSDLDKDTDGDGLPDVYEINGMRVPSGNVIITDPNDPDTDGDGRTDGEEMGELVDIVVEVDGEGTKKTFQVYKWVSDPNVAVMLSSEFIFVDYIDEGNNLDGYCKMEYMPYSIESYDMWYVDCLTYSYYQTINTGLIHICVAFVAGTSAEFSCTDCYQRYIYGIGGDYDGLFEGTSRHYINADFVVENMFVNNGYTNYINNMSKCMREAESLLLQDSKSDFYFATSPEMAWEGCSYWIDGNLTESLGTMCINLPALGVFNRANAATVAHCTYNDDTKKFCMEFKYVLMDYYDFSFWEELYELDAYGYARSYELYGVYYDYIEWGVNDDYEEILKESQWTNKINSSYNDGIFYPSEPRKDF